MNLPNALTVIRILLVPLFLYKAVTGEIGFAAVVYVTAAVTDGLDGFIARFWHLQTRLGAFLDPLADKLLIATSYIVLAIMGIVPLWLTFAVLSKDIIIALGSLVKFLMEGNLNIRVRAIGKITTFFQFAYALLAMIAAHAFGGGTENSFPVTLEGPLAYVTGGLTVISGAVYIIDGFRGLED